MLSHQRAADRAGALPPQDAGALVQLLDGVMRPTTEHVADIEADLLSARAELASFREAAAAHREIEEKVRLSSRLAAVRGADLAV